MNPKIFFFSFSLKIWKETSDIIALEWANSKHLDKLGNFDTKWIQLAPISDFDLEIWFSEIKFWQPFFSKSYVIHTPLILVPLGSFRYNFTEVEKTGGCPGLYLNYSW